MGRLWNVLISSQLLVCLQRFLVSSVQCPVTVDNDQAVTVPLLPSLGCTVAAG